MRLPKLTRRRFLYAAGGAVVSACGAYGYTRWIEPDWLDVVHHDMPLNGLPASLVGKTLVQMSDLHIGTTDPDYLAQCVVTVNALKPDILVITGDFMTCREGERVDSVPGVVESLQAPYGVYAVAGNHDYGGNWNQPEVADALGRRLDDCGIRLLRNEVVDVRGLQLLGLDDLWAKQFRVVPHNTAKPTVAISHNPDSADLPGWKNFRGWILSGHTHGGQCRFPFGHAPILPVKNKLYSAGAFDLGRGRSLYVNRGLGYVHKLRFNTRPEVTVFRLTANPVV